MYPKTFVWPCRQIINAICTTFCLLHNAEHKKYMIVSLCFIQPKFTKIQWQEIYFIGWNVLEFFCIPLYTAYLSDLHKKFQISSTHDTKVEYKIWSLYYNLFLSYAGKTHTHTHEDARTHRPCNVSVMYQKKKCNFLIQGTR